MIPGYPEKIEVAYNLSAYLNDTEIIATNSNALIDKLHIASSFYTFTNIITNI